MHYRNRILLHQLIAYFFIASILLFVCVVYIL